VRSWESRGWLPRPPLPKLAPLRHFLLLHSSLTQRCLLLVPLPGLSPALPPPGLSLPSPRPPSKPLVLPDLPALLSSPRLPNKRTHPLFLPSYSPGQLTPPFLATAPSSPAPSMPPLVPSVRFASSLVPSPLIAPSPSSSRPFHPATSPPPSQAALTSPITDLPFSPPSFLLLPLSSTMLVNVAQLRRSSKSPPWPSPSPRVLSNSG
jgi:hypothetical protein